MINFTQDSFDPTLSPSGADRQAGIALDEMIASIKQKGYHSYRSKTPANKKPRFVGFNFITA